MADNKQCPLINNQEIEDIECLVNIDVSEGHLKESATQERFTVNDKWKEICKNCRNHKY